MKAKLLFLLSLLMACTLPLFTSCKDRHTNTTVVVGVGHDHGHAPPAHAPAHGYRRKHHGGEIVYDSAWGVYVVIGFPGHYYYNDHYYRYHQSHWQLGGHIDGPWKTVSHETLPQRVLGMHAAKDKPMQQPGRGRGRGAKKSKKKV
jgi:hypothetical protein